ncbi:MAG: YggS family pyridoxal phosphate-dependent enzyme, partial [Clostridiaceae bacterium]|nr:YggS family pyridoxal phosphate-dependent enzyme [Clostridiaceae bacterium]
FYDHPERARPVFAWLRCLRDLLSGRHAMPELTELSMGMTGDFKQAIAEGATLVRIGSAIFGQRNP